MIEKRLLILLFQLLVIGTSAQNVGILTDKPQGPLHIDALKNNETGPVATKNNDDILVSANGYLGVGTITPVARVDVRSSENNNAIGIGDTSLSAATIGAGAIKYNPATKELNYSDGANWIPLSHEVPKAFVDAKNASGNSFSNNAVNIVANWTKLNDVTNSFDPLTGIFKAPANGIYVATFNFAFATGVINDNSRIETILHTNNTTSVQDFKCVNSFPGSQTGTTSQVVTGSCSGIFNLNTNDTIDARIFHDLGVAKNLNADASLTSFNVFGL